MTDMSERYLFAGESLKFFFGFVENIHDPGYHEVGQE